MGTKQTATSWRVILGIVRLAVLEKVKADIFNLIQKQIMHAWTLYEENFVKQLTAGAPLLSALGPLGVAACWASSACFFFSAGGRYEFEKEKGKNANQYAS